MHLQLIEGQYTVQESIELLTQLLQVKIKFHESKIEQTSSEEDISYRESRLRYLQQELANLRSLISSNNGTVQMSATIQVQLKQTTYETIAA
ncbi:hypothetical protein IQ13_1084 [Lacibacter cauensis]|uniref:Uncharacterized protein n=1 Tax=Lacibacter cauensis TaxID=510947 RepID=A0A562SNT8_9BACT|nr:hypothetical protein [Lacibacter cauensis]TWI82979.1 hypothetical protein IQ13_1084 [Lacibacter cauensis]